MSVARIRSGLAAVVLLWTGAAAQAQIDWDELTRLEESGEVEAALARLEDFSDSPSATDETAIARTRRRLLHELGRYEEAQQAGREWIELAERSADPDERMSALRTTARSFAPQQRYQEIAELLERAFVIAQDHGTPVQQAQIGLNLVSMLMHLAHYARIGDLLDNLEPLIDAAGDQRLIAAWWVRRGDLYRNLGEPLAAIEAFRRAAEIAEELGDPRATADSQLRLAQVNIGHHDYAEAIVLLRRGLDSLPDGVARGPFLANLGICHYELNQIDEAEAAFEQMRRDAVEIGSERYESWANGELGLVAWKRGDAELAQERFDRAIALCRSSGDLANEVPWWIDKGMVRRDQERFADALVFYREAANVIERRGGTRGVAGLDTHMGQSYAGLGDHAKAEELFLRALTQATQDGDIKTIWEAELGLARLHRGAGRLEDAALAYDRALDAIETVRGSLRIEGFKRDFFRDKVTIYAEVIEFLLTEADDPGRAFEIAERSRARAFLDSLAEARAGLEETLPAAVVDAERELLGRLSELQAKARRGEGSPKLDSEIEAVERDIEALELRVRTEFPRFRQTRFVDPVSIAELQDVLAADEVVLAFFLAEPASHLWVIRQGGLTHHRLAAASDIESMTRSAFAGLIQPESEPTLDALAESLLATVFDQAASLPSSVILIPSGILHYLPFEVLPVGHDAAPLGTIVQTSYTPSASTLMELRRRPTVVQTVAWFGLGDPTPDRSTQTTRGGGLAGVRELGALPHSRTEIERVASIFGRASATVLLGDAATEERLKADDRRHSVIHIATHGWVDPSSSAASGLVLASSDTEDGLLQFREILRLPLAADLVTLSACQSSLGELVTGEGMVGLARAFFYAGADSVVATLWNVDDEASAEFMESFYMALREGATKSEALRRARAEMRQDPRYRHPYYWAPYVLHGRGEDTVDFPRRWEWMSLGLLVLVVVAVGIWLRLRSPPG